VLAGSAADFLRQQPPAVRPTARQIRNLGAFATAAEVVGSSDQAQNGSFSDQQARKLPVVSIGQSTT